MRDISLKVFFSVCVVLALASCQSPGKNKTGSEYMPDMGHSIAYEANVMTYYGLNTWGSKEEYHSFVQPRIPVEGTIARSRFYSEDGYSKFRLPDVNSVPYHYEDTEEGRERAIREIIKSPYPITDSGLRKGKELYEIFCATCHGEKADGAGYLVRDDGGKYPVAPANLLLDEHIESSNGRMYHAIMVGRNLMGAYKDKMNHEERWYVIQYIRSLQAASKGLIYSPTENSLNSDTPAAALAAKDLASDVE